MKKFVIFTILTVLLGVSMSGITAHAQNEEIPIVYLEGVEDMTPEEAQEYISSYIDDVMPLDGITELSGNAEIEISGTKIKITFRTQSLLGVAEEIGVKTVSVQYREEGEHTYYNVPVNNSFVEYDSMGYYGSYEVAKPKVGMYYRGKQRHYMIKNGVQYAFFTYTEEKLYTGK